MLTNVRILDCGYTRSNPFLAKLIGKVTPVSVIGVHKDVAQITAPDGSYTYSLFSTEGEFRVLSPLERLALALEEENPVNEGR